MRDMPYNVYVFGLDKKNDVLLTTRHIYPSNIFTLMVTLKFKGLADTFCMMKLPYESAEAAKLNVQIFETIYFGGLEASCELAAVEGPYETYNGFIINHLFIQKPKKNILHVPLLFNLLKFLFLILHQFITVPITSVFSALNL